MGFYDSILQPVFGGKPEVADYKPVDLTEEQKKAILGNIGNFGDISKLGGLYQDYMTSQTEKLLPGYSSLLVSGGKGAQSLLDTGQTFLKGELPQDVKDAVQRSSAYRSFSGGFGGSGMASGLTARDLGLTSLDLIGKGASMLGQGGNAAQQWTALARGNQMNPASMFIDPTLQANTTTQNNLRDQQYRQNLFNVEASPDPVASGISNTIMSLLGSYLGGGMGGGGGAAQGGKTFSPVSTTPWYMNAQQGAGW